MKYKRPFRFTPWKEPHICLRLFATFFYISLADANSSFKCDSQDLVEDSPCIIKSTLVFNAKRTLAYLSTYFHLWIFRSRHVAPATCNGKKPKRTQVWNNGNTLPMYTYHNWLHYKFFGYHLITCDSFTLPKGEIKKKIKFKFKFKFKFRFNQIEWKWLSKLGWQCELNCLIFFYFQEWYQTKRFWGTLKITLLTILLVFSRIYFPPKLMWVW